MPRSTLTAVLLVALSACQGSDPQPLQLVFRDRFHDGPGVVAGGGASEFVGYFRPNGVGFGMDLRLVRHRAANPDQLEVVGELPTSDVSTSPMLALSGPRAVWWLGSTATLVDLADPGLATTTIALALSGPTSMAVGGHWLLAADGRQLELVDLNSPGTPASFQAPAAVTSLLATQDLFLAFTTSGYVLVTPAGATPTFQAFDDAIIRNFQSAFADGTDAMVSGPGLAFSSSRVVRLDLTVPAAPVIVRSIEVPREYAGFAWDGAGTSVVGVLVDSFGPVLEGYLVHEQADGFSARGIPFPSTRAIGTSFAAHADRLIVQDSEGLGLYRFQ